MDDDDFDDITPHVMISYQWGVQTQMIKIKERLRESGYNVWMDVDNMGKSAPKISHTISFWKYCLIKTITVKI